MSATAWRHLWCTDGWSSAPCILRRKAGIAMTATKHGPRVPALTVEFRGASIRVSTIPVAALTGTAFVLGTLLPTGRLGLPALLFGVVGAVVVTLLIRMTVLRWRGLRRRADRIQVREGYLATILFTEVLITSGTRVSKNGPGIIALTPQALLLLDETGEHGLSEPIPRSSLVRAQRIDHALRAAVPALSIESGTVSVALALPTQSGVSIGAVTELDVDSLAAGPNAWIAETSS